MIGAVVSVVAGLFGELVKDWREGRANKRAIKRAVAKNKIRLAESAVTHNAAWEMAVLENSDRWLRRVSFLVLVFPLLWAGVDPEGAREYFDGALAALPAWYVPTLQGVFAAIWGIAELRRYLGAKGSAGG